MKLSLLKTNLMFELLFRLRFKDENLPVPENIKKEIFISRKNLKEEGKSVYYNCFYQEGKLNEEIIVRITQIFSSGCTKEKTSHRLV